MLGRVIDEVLTDEERGRLLTSKLGPTPNLYDPETGCNCFYGSVLAVRTVTPANLREEPLVPNERSQYEGWRLYAALFKRCRDVLPRRWFVIDADFDDATFGGWWFDDLCRRFGDARVANAIRNRVLSPRTRAERIALRLSTESAVR